MRQKQPGTVTKAMQSMDSISHQSIQIWDSVYFGNASRHFAENKDLSLRRPKKKKERKPPRLNLNCFASFCLQYTSWGSSIPSDILIAQPLLFHVCIRFLGNCIQMRQKEETDTVFIIYSGLKCLSRSPWLLKI